MWVSLWASTALLLHAPQRHAVISSARLPGARACAGSEEAVTRLFVGGIPFGMTETDVGRMFDGLALPHEVSPVVEVCLVLGRNGAPRGYGFVELATPAQAKRALTLMDGRAVSYDGRMPTTLQVREADPSSSDAPLPRPIAGRVLWVGNLDFKLRSDAIREAFAGAAGVAPEDVRCSVALDHRGRSRGFGTVCFADTEAAARARVALDNSELSGRTLSVRVDRRAGVPAANTDKDLAAPAADAIDPGLLAAIEEDMFSDEEEVRREQATARQQVENAGRPA